MPLNNISFKNEQNYKIHELNGLILFIYLYDIRVNRIKQVITGILIGY